MAGPGGGSLGRQPGLHGAVSRRRKATRPCLFCGSTASLSREHVIPRWVNKELGIHAMVEERSGTVRRLGALSVVLPQVCIKCNTGSMSELEQRTAPVLGPMLLGPALPVVLDAAQQASLATWDAGSGRPARTRHPR